MSRSLIVTFLFLLSDSCVSPYETTTPFFAQIIVQGTITDQPGPYLVNITKTLAVNDQLDKPPPLSGASVTIKDDLGASESLAELSPGNYYTTAFQGIVGRSYFITIATSDGNVYQSASEKLAPVGDFSAHYEVGKNEVIGADNQPSVKNGFKIYVDGEVLPEQENRVLWRTTGTFEIRTFPELHVDYLGGPPQHVEGPSFTPIKVLTLPTPLICSGYIASGKVLLGPYRPCTCCICWVTQYNESPILSDAQFITDGKIKNFYVDFIEANGRTLYSRYHLKIDQMSVSESVYQFWQGIKTQNQNSSNLFQTPPAMTKGNLSALTANAPSIIGFFAASSIKHYALDLDRTELPYKLEEIDTLPISCTDAYKYSSTIKPTFW